MDVLTTYGPMGRSNWSATRKDGSSLLMAGGSVRPVCSCECRGSVVSSFPVRVCACFGFFFSPALRPHVEEKEGRCCRMWRFVVRRAAAVASPPARSQALRSLHQQRLRPVPSHPRTSSVQVAAHGRQAMRWNEPTFSARTFASKTDEEKSDKKEDQPGGGGFFANLWNEVSKELEKSEELKEFKGKLNELKQETEKQAEEANMAQKADKAKEEARKTVDAAKKQSEDLFESAKSATSSVGDSWKKMTNTVKEQVDKLEKENEYVREAAKKAKEAQEQASSTAKDVTSDGRFQSIAQTAAVLGKEAKDDLFGADKATRKERREQRKRIRERKAERRDARKQAAAEKKAMAEKKASGEDVDGPKKKAAMTSDWAEAIDEDSGDPYYYNVKTGETTWDKPDDLGGENEAAAVDGEDVGPGENHEHGEDAEGGRAYEAIGEDEARAYFDGFDMSSSGSITEEDFDALVDQIAQNRPDLAIPQTRTDVLAALERMDPDASGIVQLDAFLDWIEAYTASGGESHGEQLGGGALILRGDLETAWQRTGERLRKTPLIADILGASEYASRQFEETEAGKKTRNVRNRVTNLREDAQEVWETSQNPWVYRFASAYDGMTAETEQGQAIKELRRMDPGWDLIEWFEEVNDEIAPALLRGYLEGDEDVIEAYCVEQAAAVIKASVKDNKLSGKIPDPTVLDVRGVELLAARVLQKAPPILVVKFQTQQIACVRNKQGEVIEGAEDKIEACFYYMAMQRNWDEVDEELKWEVLEFQIVGKLEWH